MRSLLVLLTVAAAAQAQYSGSVGAASFSSASAGGFGSSAGVGFGRPVSVGAFGSSSGVGGSVAAASYGSGGFGSGGPIIFPSAGRPGVNLPVRPGGRPFGRPGAQPAGPFPVRPAPQLTSQYPICSPGVVDHQALGSRYHFSWCHDGFQNYTQDRAVAYCRALGPGWNGVSIETSQEDQLVSQIVGGHNLAWIWTAGVRDFNGVFQWPSNTYGTVPLNYNNWSHTGLDGRPQPDNRENNNEQCLAILNNFYNDGIKWHDIGCHHLKPIICEQHL
ncbi:uncharacterized protein LOC134770392 [Penaeus indicus]|uniref:uncharacterized protein LOC134770392 n=1 Tax=Penaeus indicus TaxID=29960 RepID=UPI00300C12ED